jgi:transcription initiation protein SPT3
MVRSLCVTALEVRERHEAPLRQAQSSVTSTSKASGPNNTSPVKRKSTLLDSPNKRTRTSPELADRERERDQSTTRRHAPAPLFAPPPSARQPLTSTHVLEAYAQIQRQQAANRVGGMRNFRGGLAKGRMALV